MEQAIDRGEFNCRCANPGNLTQDERAEYDQFEAQFFPQPDSYRWYQCFTACHWLVHWQKELGKRAFPQWCWTILSGERHSVAVGLDSKDRIRMILDILCFDQFSAIEILEFASNSRKPQPESEPQEDSFEAIVREVAPYLDNKGVPPTNKPAQQIALAE